MVPFFFQLLVEVEPDLFPGGEVLADAVVREFKSVLGQHRKKDDEALRKTREIRLVLMSR